MNFPSQKRISFDLPFVFTLVFKQSVYHFFNKSNICHKKVTTNLETAF